MRKMVDAEQQEEVTEFGYTNKLGKVEFLQIDEELKIASLMFTGSSGYPEDMSEIYVEDLPKLILAAQAVMREVADRKARNA